VPEHSGIGLGLLADVGNGPTVPELHGMQGAGEPVAVLRVGRVTTTHASRAVTTTTSAATRPAGTH
jgi:hypothetical protein